MRAWASCWFGLFSITIYWKDSERLQTFLYMESQSSCFALSSIRSFVSIIASSSQEPVDLYLCTPMRQTTQQGTANRQARIGSSIYQARSERPST